MAGEIGWSGSVDTDSSRRRVPLLSVAGLEGDRAIFTGWWLIVPGVSSVKVLAQIEAVWQEGDVWRRLDDRDPLPAPPNTPTWIEEVPMDGVDVDAKVSQVIKARCEDSRGHVAGIRAVRYDLERRLAQILRGGAETSTIDVLCGLVELNGAAGRARDSARQAVREGLWLWATDPDAYHAYRQRRDPSLTLPNPSWHPRQPDRLHDVAMRHCEAMVAELGDEQTALGSVLTATATVAASKDAEAQERLNRIAGAAAVGIGLPSLVLAYYGADRLLELDSFGRLATLGPILLAALLAMVVAVDFLPGRTRRRRLALGVLVASILMAFLLVAGLLLSILGAA